MSRAGRHRPGLAVEPAGGLSPAADDVEARLLGQPRSMRPGEVSARASVSLRSARKFWHALGFPNVGDEDTVFTETDVLALQAVAGLVRDGIFDEPTALAMTRALARTTDRLAVWQTQLMAEALGEAMGEAMGELARTTQSTGDSESTGSFSEHRNFREQRYPRRAGHDAGRAGSGDRSRSCHEAGGHRR